MQKDLKTGMVLGLVLAAVAVVWLSTRPSLSTKARMLRSNNAVSPQETPSPPNNLSPAGLTTEAHTPAQRRNIEDAENSQLSIINNYSERFHIVRKGETLSDISRKYYGSANKWQKILEANTRTIKDANRIRPGTKLIIPE